MKGLAEPLQRPHACAHWAPTPKRFMTSTPVTRNKHGFLPAQSASKSFFRRHCFQLRLSIWTTSASAPSALDCRTLRRPSTGEVCWSTGWGVATLAAKCSPWPTPTAWETLFSRFTAAPSASISCWKTRGSAPLHTWQEHGGLRWNGGMRSAREKLRKNWPAPMRSSTKSCPGAPRPSWPYPKKNAPSSSASAKNCLPPAPKPKRDRDRLILPAYKRQTRTRIAPSPRVYLLDSAESGHWV